MGNLVKTFEKTDPFVRKAYQKSNGDWLPVEPSSAPEIIGLSYNNFRRTIIIPQGQFQEFLQLGPKDRTQMLKELFNLGKFELYYKLHHVFVHERSNGGHVLL